MNSFKLFSLLGILILQSVALHSKEWASTLETTSYRQLSTVKTTINITYPNGQTVWTAPSMVELKWVTRNIATSKTIKFYLTKDDMVVQELGIFENNRFISGVQLDRGLQDGTNYRVIGIELFPDDKYSIAKYATPLFTIKKELRTKPAVVKIAKKQPIVRDMFNGRKLTYVREIEVSGNEIHINLWDHGRKDGDIVSIYLNGEAVVSKYLLTYQKKQFNLKLNTSKPNDLFLYAHNLGRFPPNTVSIEISDGERSENIILNSDLKRCEAVLINVKE